MVVEAKEDLQSRVVTTVADSVLRLYYNGNLNGKGKRITVYITCPDLRSLQASGASVIQGSSAFTVSDLELHLSGGSSLKLKLQATKLVVEAAGAGVITLEGKADNQRVQLSGASHYDASQLESKSVEINASGASVVKIAVENELKAGLTGASTLHYQGNPTVRQLKPTGISIITSSD